MNVFLIDGTYELYRHFYAVPSATDVDGREVGAVRGVIRSVLSMLEDDVTHLGVATDHVIESFRNQLWSGYKTGEGIDPALFAQFHPLEEALEALGVVVWPMTDLEADDALASAAARASDDLRVEQVFICTPDKDLAQCVIGQRVVQFDRRAGALRDADGVLAKFGVPPASIPDYLALVGDAADGFPGLRGWGAKSTALVLARYLHLEAIPDDAATWDVEVRGARRLVAELAAHRDLAARFRDLATLRTEAPVFETVDDLAWIGSRPTFFEVCARLNTPELFTRAKVLAGRRAS
ncbi:MAG: flap endonuclease [Acidobacteria bacterium]|jgi:5'-3' exonuclease|nr:flap endonuclease [Acidobacteriota bacterium]MDP7338639.1 5'-3' exonuclease H3TH domain-containing protein [Vicinamibacterales bacterium]MDP7478203.1 5'-3' exonuclease H3TH domain-containing protein [Vicinamibacterales bacterium]MDP7690600.1 5'-3' exonuclease H3TH domain-containing protein [Vicinamibacterales bacterium]HJN44025.1 5'-3' exonuclease H3TH domain-containing protein [Vicinamibacterales bacterium]|tara:strand:- start:23 stop:904 length:882 start_codon:yes stop_codon:yes gene_type:complete